MANKENEAVFRRMVEEAFGGGRPELIDELVAEDCIEHQFGFDPPDREGNKRGTAFLHRLAPDFEIRVEDMVSEGDKVWGRMRARGTHTGPGLGEPTGRTFDITVMDVVRIRNGKIVEHWGVPDRFAQLSQLGLLPRANGAEAGRHA